jgi:sulfide:quinone oxidoreductase
VNKQTLETRFPGVYAVGDVNGVGTPKAGVFAEGSARVVAAAIIAQLRGEPVPEAYTGRGSCYVEFGDQQVGRVDVDFLSGPKPTGTFHAPSESLVVEKPRSDRAACSAGSAGCRSRTEEGRAE